MLHSQSAASITGCRLKALPDERPLRLMVQGIFQNRQIVLPGEGTTAARTVSR